MPVMIVFRSLTHGQRASHMLQRNGIPCTLIKAPSGSWEKGCAYALRLDRRRLTPALTVLQSNGVVFLRVVMPDGNGGIREVIQ